MAPIIIVGSGLAGYSLAREYRKLNKTQPLLIITSDDGRAYSKPMLSNALAKGKTADELVTASAEKMAEQLGAQIRPHTRVVALKPQTHEIVLENETIQYHKLVLALGADPIRLPLDGDAEQILSVNDLLDYARFRQALSGKSRVAILGGGFIGCEFANDLAPTGYQVHLIDRQSQPLAAWLPGELSQALLERLRAIGVVWHGGASVARIDKLADSFCLSMSDDSRIECDVVLSAIGLTPRIELARAAGIKVNRGIVADRYLQTSVDDIYALGDCAEVAGFVLPFVMPLMRGARTLAQTLAGEPTQVDYPAMPVALKTPAYPISIQPPPAACDGVWSIDKTEQGIKALFHDSNGALRGFALGGVTNEAATLAKEIPPLFE